MPAMRRSACSARWCATLDVELGGRARKIQLVGQTELYGVACGALILANGEARPRHHLRAMFDHLVLAAAGLADLGGFKHLVLTRGKPKAGVHERWPRAEAQAHLAALLRDLFADGHAYLLSLDMQIDVLEGQAASVVQASDFGPGSIGYGPLKSRDDLELPADVRALAERRLGPMWRRMRLT
jgi:hypothetical protein